MRFFVLALALASAACGQQTQQQADAGCAREATHEVTWSSEDAPDTITTRAEGPTCGQTAVIFTVRNAAGDPLWAFASTYYDLTVGGAPPPDAAPPTEAEMDTFLTGWADVSEMRTTELPEWRAGAASLTESVQGFAYETPFDRETYERLRAANLRAICYAAAMEGSHCLIIDPPTGAAIRIVAFGP